MKARVSKETQTGRCNSRETRRMSQWGIRRKLESKSPLKRKWTFVRHGKRTRCRQSSKSNILYVTTRVGKVSGWRKWLWLPRENPAGIPRTCNYDRDLLNTNSNEGGTDQGDADLSIVIKRCGPTRTWRHIWG